MVDITTPTLTPVKDLTADTPEGWHIRVRALAKSPIKTHARGKLFKVETNSDRALFHFIIRLKIRDLCQQKNTLILFILIHKQLLIVKDV